VEAVLQQKSLEVVIRHILG